MERLTEKDEQGNKLVLKNSVECFGDELRHWTINQSPTGTQTIRGYAVDKFAEYEELEERGLLLKLPCKVWDKLYQPTRGFVSIFIVRFIEISTCDNLFIHTRLFSGINMTGDVFSEEDIGKTVFLTQAGAEEALERMEDMRNE